MWKPKFSVLGFFFFPALTIFMTFFRFVLFPPLAQPRASPPFKQRKETPLTNVPAAARMMPGLPSRDRTPPSLNLRFLLCGSYPWSFTVRAGQIVFLYSAQWRFWTAITSLSLLLSQMSAGCNSPNQASSSRIDWSFSPQNFQGGCTFRQAFTSPPPPIFDLMFPTV